MLRRTAATLSYGRQPQMFKETMTEKEVDARLNMDRVYRNLSLEKREYRRPWYFEKDMRGAVVHLSVHSPKKPQQLVGTVLDVSHNTTNMDGWVRLFVKQGKWITNVRFPLMNPMMEYRIVRDRDDVKVWENYIKEMGHQKVMYTAARGTRKITHNIVW
eukprot:TRINITY_DN10075_c0_g1_i1.p3 TRINITY_DN10075_c0_g1~~TRINITY_DN10075_c0_g1_i1.p3  ORF type:complete len:181 (+),score=79.92 TRINITY_DN10075_c0_g1_i1:69-545(+)